MFGNQRPAAPWSFNNWWGQYDTYADLPNVAGSSLQLPRDVQAGDMAWVRETGAIYVCIDPTQGAAEWGPLVAVPQADAVIDIYVAPLAANASDSNAGTLAAPLATFDELIRRIRSLYWSHPGLESPVVGHLASYALYEWSVPLTNIPLNAPLTIICDGAGQLGDTAITQLATGTGGAGTTASLIDVTALAPAVDALTDKSVVFTSGAAAGQIRTVRNNTATDLVPSFPFSPAPAPGDTYVVFESGAIITIVDPPNQSLIGSAPPIISNVGTPYNVDDLNASFRQSRNLSSLLLANLTFNIADSVGVLASMGIAGSSIGLAGVEFRSDAIAALVQVLADIDSFIIAGCDQPLSTFSEFQLPYRAGELAGTPLALPSLSSCDTVTKWTGWGASVTMDTAALVFRPARFAGFLNYSVDFSGSGAELESVRWTLYGGQVRAVATVLSNGNVLGISNQSEVIVLSLGGTATAWRAVGAGNSNSSAGIVVSGGSKLSLSNAEITITGSGVGIAAAGDQLAFGWLQAGLISIVTGVTITAPRAGIVVCYGGKVYWDTAPTMGGTLTIGQAVITQSAISGAAVAPSPTVVATVADGVVVVNPDGSGSLYGRIT